MEDQQASVSPDGADECHCSQRGCASCADDRDRAESGVGAISRLAAARCGGRRVGSCAFLTAFSCWKRRHGPVLSVGWRPGRSGRSIGRVAGLRRFAIRLSKTCCASKRSSGLLPIRRCGCAASWDAFLPDASRALMPRPPAWRSPGRRVGRMVSRRSTARNPAPGGPGGRL